MPNRKIIAIDQQKCNGCGLCVAACHEGALQLVNGKATLVSESYCDGLGACLPECPIGAIRIEERGAAAFDEAAVARHLAAEAAAAPAHACPGTMARRLKLAAKGDGPAATASDAQRAVSELRQWPCQIKLAPVNAHWFDNCSLLIAADCTAYAHANLHADFMRGKITLIGCPKLDLGDYADKLAAIFAAHAIRDVTVLRMEVPCCGGLDAAVRRALAACGKPIPCQTVVIGTSGEVLKIAD
ncbi:MAG: 4Fe-4S binding protein [Kiritimatiellae bacterium]|nr:4Fe-4S binding protein [Kiritimatiellia bacterium]